MKEERYQDPCSGRVVELGVGDGGTGALVHG